MSPFNYTPTYVGGSEADNDEMNPTWAKSLRWQTGAGAPTNDGRELNEGVIYLNTTTSELYRSTGSAWELVGSLGSGATGNLVRFQNLNPNQQSSLRPKTKASQYITGHPSSGPDYWIDENKKFRHPHIFSELPGHNTRNVTWHCIARTDRAVGVNKVQIKIPQTEIVANSPQQNRPVVRAEMRLTYSEAAEALAATESLARGVNLTGSIFVGRWDTGFPDTPYYYYNFTERAVNIANVPIGQYINVWLGMEHLGNSGYSISNNYDFGFDGQIQFGADVLAS